MAIQENILNIGLHYDNVIYCPTHIFMSDPYIYVWPIYSLSDLYIYGNGFSRIYNISLWYAIKI